MRSGTSGMIAHTLLPVQARVFEAVASSDPLIGTPRDLAQQFSVEPDDFLASLDGLIVAGWVTVVTDPDGTINIHLEH
jgi:hypothetical protein